jgi:tetratricopeptide (TPR) repeat protein
MAFNIGAIVSVSGEKEFNTAMNSMKQNLKYVSAEANAAISVFGKNEKSIESLTTQNNGLKKALEVQRQGIKEIEKAMAQLVADGLDPASNKYKQLKANLDNTTAAANRTEQEIKENEEAILELEQAATKNEQAMDKNTEAMGEMGEGGKGLGSVIQGVANKFGITLPENMTKAVDGFGGLDAKMVAVVGTCAAVVAAIVAIEKALIDLTVTQASVADDIMTLSSTTGMTTEKIQELKYSSELLDVSFETISGSMTKMIRSMDTARDGSGDAADAYKQLGVDVADANGELRDAGEVFYEVIDRLGEMSNETERDAAAMQIFGKSARELNPLIEAGSDRIKEFADEAHNAGYVLSNETLSSLGSVDDAVQRLNNQMEATKNTIAEQMAPAVEQLLIDTTTGIENLKRVLEESGIVDVFAALIEIFNSLNPLLDVFFGQVEGGVRPLEALAYVLSLIADALKIVTNSIAAAVEGFRQLINLISGNSMNLDKYAQYGENMRSIFSGNGSAGRALNNMFGSISHYATGTSCHPGGPALVGENGPELVNLRRGTQVFTNAETRNMLTAGTSVGVLNVYPNERQWGQVMQLLKQAQGARQRNR